MVRLLGRLRARSMMATSVPMTGPSTVMSEKMPAVCTPPKAAMLSLAAMSRNERAERARAACAVEVVMCEVRGRDAREKRVRREHESRPGEENKQKSDWQLGRPRTTTMQLDGALRVYYVLGLEVAGAPNLAAPR